MVASDDLLESGLDDLYAAPVEEFTQRRNDLSKRLRDGGDEEGAKRVRSLRKPSLPIWALNQIARRNTSDIQELLDVHEALVDVVDAAQMRELSKKRHRLVSRLVDAGGSILEESGHSAGSQTLERMSRTLLAANSPQEKGLLRRGRLQTELQEHGFDGMIAEDMVFEPSKPSKAKRKRLEHAEDLDSKAGDAAREAAELRRIAERLKRDAARADAAARAADDKATAAEGAARRAEEAAVKARAKL